jgi:hypothetical protein
MLALHGAATVILLVFVYRLWLHLPLQHRPYTPGFVTALMAIPLVNLAWHFVALPGWVRRYQAFRREQGGTVHPRLLPLGYWTGALWAATWVPFLAVLAGPAAVVTQLVFINAAAREVNGETAVAGDQPQPEVAGA